MDLNRRLPLCCDGEACMLAPFCGGCNHQCRHQLCPTPDACVDCPAVCRRRRDLGRLFGDADGADWAQIVSVPQTFPDMPRYLPIIERQPGRRFPNVPLRPYLVPIRKTVTPKRLLKRTETRDNLHLPRDVPLFLGGHGEDLLLHRIWAAQALEAVCGGNWWSDLADGYECLLAPDFSVWDNSPRAEHVLEMKRTLICMRNAQEAGITAFPNLFWDPVSSDADFGRWIDWLDANPGVAAVTINYQLPVGHEDWPERRSNECRHLKKLAVRLSWRPKLIAVGIAQPEDVSAFADTDLDIYVCNGRAYHEARSGKELVFEGKRIRTVERPSTSKNDLLSKNLDLIDEVYATILR